MREVDDVEDAPYEAEAHAHRNIDASGQQAENDQLDEGGQNLVSRSDQRWSHAGVGYWGFASATLSGKTVWWAPFWICSTTIGL